MDVNNLSFITNDYMDKVVVGYSNCSDTSKRYILTTDFNHQYNLKYLSCITPNFNNWYFNFEYTNNIHELFNNDLNIMLKL